MYQKEVATLFTANQQYFSQEKAFPLPSADANSKY